MLSRRPASCQPGRRRDHRQSRRLAHDHARPGVPQHAAVTAVAAGGAPGGTSPRPPCRTSSGGTRAGGRSWRNRSGSPSWSWCKPWPRRSGSPSCSTTSSTYRSIRSRQSSTAAPPRHASSPAGLDAGYAGSPASRTLLGSQRRVVDAFFAAARRGDLEALVAILDPEVVLRADLGPTPASRVVRGVSEVVRYARAPADAVVLPALVSSAAGAVILWRGPWAMWPASASSTWRP